MADNDAKRFGVRQTDGLTVNVVVPGDQAKGIDTNKLPAGVVFVGEASPPAPAQEPPPLPEGQEALITRLTARGPGDAMVPMQYNENPTGELPLGGPGVNLTEMTANINPAVAIPGMAPTGAPATPPLGSVPGGMNNQPNAPGVVMGGGNADGTVAKAVANDGTLPDGAAPAPNPEEGTVPPPPDASKADASKADSNPDDVDPDKVDAPANANRTPRRPTRTANTPDETETPS